LAVFYDNIGYVLELFRGKCPFDVYRREKA
jgi:hypothetical protein